MSEYEGLFIAFTNLETARFSRLSKSKPFICTKYLIICQLPLETDD